MAMTVIPRARQLDNYPCLPASGFDSLPPTITIRFSLLVALTCATALAQQPRIDSISPAQGPIAGATIVTIRGASFTGASVKLDGAVVTALSQSDSEVRLQMPKHDNGYALMQVGSAAAEFLYVPPRLEELPPGYITTIAGVGSYIRLEQPATRSMVLPWGLAIAANGDIYFAQSDRGLVLRVRADGILQRVAGSLRPDFSKPGDGGPALDAHIGFPRSVAIDSAGNVYVGDNWRARVRRIDSITGIITTAAGTGDQGFSGDGGQAAQAQIREATHLFCTPDGTLYFLDDNVRVRKVATDGIITTVAGNGTIGESGDGGPAVNAQLNSPIGDGGDLAVDADGNLFILETEGQRVRKVDAKSSVITTFASLDARGLPYRKARGLATDAARNVYVATQENINKYDPTGRLIESWFTGHGFSEDGAAAKQALIGGPTALVIGPTGDIIYSDEAPSRLRRINLATGKLETVAGMAPNVIGVPGPAVGAVLTSPWSDLALLPSGDLIFGDGNANWIYRIDLRSGAIATFAGTGGLPGRYDESPALQTDLISGLVALEADSRGYIYFADKNSIRSIDPNGRVHLIAQGRPADTLCTLAGDGGLARDARLCQPGDVSLDRNGNLYIADTNNNRIRRVDAQSGIITTVAGNGPVNGFEGYGHGSFCGDGGPALSACFNTPIAVAVRDDGALYVIDYYNDPSIRKIAPDGTISSIPNWPQAKKLIVGPGQSIFANGGTQIYRADGDRVRLIVGGGGFGGFSGDGGLASLAKTSGGEAELATGLITDSEGNLFFHDAGNRRIRAVRYGAVLAPPGATIQATATAGTIRAAVFDVDSHPAPGVRVDFTAPASGASCILSSPFAITDPTGNAAVTCTSNCIAGTYSVAAQALTASSLASVSLTNPAGPCRRRAARH
jgi:sugar lactone lactonase YvrE